MKLNTALANDFASEGFGEARKFGFEMNPMAFHAVINGIYSDKITAPVREYSTNAYDAHQMVGKGDEPFILMAPSTFNPYFMVRDFGPGMTHEQVMERATTMFASDKRDTNDQVGMLGLGMKSGFAYTKQYTITCYDGVEQREYVCFLDAAGSPTVTAMEPMPSTEPRGVKITFPVQQGDIPRFQAAISRVMIGFDPMPKILNDQWSPAKPTTIMEGSNFRIVTSDFIRTPHIRQGCVLYPFNVSGELDDYEYSTVPVIIDVPIGTASVSTSREQLGYDETTKKNLGKIWQQVKDEIRHQIKTTLDEPDDFLDACIRYRELSASLPDKLVGHGTMWREKFNLRSTFPHIGSRTVVRVSKLDAWDDLEWVSVRQPSRRSYWQTAPHFKPEDLKEMTVCWEGEDCTFGKDRLRKFRSENPDVDILWVKTDYLKDFTKIYGIEDVVDLSKYEREKLPSTRRRVRGLKKTDIRRFDRFRTVIDHLEFDEDLIYVRSDGAKYSLFGETMDYDQIQQKYLEPARNITMIDVPIIVLMKNQESFARERPNWKSLEDFLQELANSFDPKDFVRKEEFRRLFLDRTVSKLSRRKADLPKRLQAFFDSIGEVEALKLHDRNLADFWHLITGKTLPPVKTYWKERWAKLTARYPLLDVVYSDDEHLDHYLKLIAR